MLYWLAAMLFVGTLFGAGQLYKHIQTEQTQSSSAPVVIETPASEGQPRMITTYGHGWTEVWVFAPFTTIASAEKTYRVRKGDQLGKVARAHGLKGWGSLYRRNRKVIGGNPDLIKPGQLLLITAQTASTPSRASENMGKGKVQTAKSFQSCGVCHVQNARTMDKVDCSICHNSQQVVTAATREAKRLVTTRRAARSPSVFYWRHPGANPFSTEKHPRDYARIIRQFSLPSVIREELVQLVSNNQLEFITIAKGDRFLQMAFGNYHLAKNVISAWSDSSHLEAARAWQLDTNIGLIQVVIPLRCGNIAWRFIPRATPEPPPPTKVEEPTPTPEPPPPTKVEEPRPTPEPPPAELEPPVKLGCNYGLDWEGNAFGGIRRSVSGNAWHNYDGMNLAIFPVDCPRGPDHWRIGLSGEVVAFDGDINGNDRLKYEGHRVVYGAEAQYFTQNTKTVFDLRYGQKTVEVKTAGGYRADEKVDLLNVDLVHSDWNTGIAAIKMLQYGVHTDWDLGGHKSSNVNGALLPASRDPRLDGSEISTRIRGLGNEIGKTGLSPFVQLEAAYLPGPQIYAVEPRIGVEIEDGWATLEGAYRANYQSGVKNDDTAGVSFNLSLDKIWKQLKGR